MLHSISWVIWLKLPGPSTGQAKVICFILCNLCTSTYSCTHSFEISLDSAQVSSTDARKSSKALSFHREKTVHLLEVFVPAEPGQYYWNSIPCFPGGIEPVPFHLFSPFCYVLLSGLATMYVDIQNVHDAISQLSLPLFEVSPSAECLPAL